MQQYRRDIDGLRALAVVPVVAFHAAPTMAPGGFIGVDIFFVISGFLITSILVDQMEQKRFSLLEFYERRARRILPALCACLIVSALAAFMLLPPAEMMKFGKSLVSVVLFSSNILFWRQSGYFAAPAQDKPLLHTWSLSVEEQFYLLWPLMLALLFAGRLRNMIGLILILIGLASLAGSVLIVHQHPGAVFFLAPLRAWELALGAFLAVTVTTTAPPKIVREIGSTLGLAAILVSIFAFSSDTPLPALVPCGGAGLVIYLNRSGDTLTNQILSFKPIVFIGLISYSLYLWHWPIFVFSAIGFNRPLTAIETIIAVAVTFVAAILSWRYIEGPFRRRQKPRPSRALVFGSAVAALSVLGTAGLASVASNGFQFRASAETKRAEASVDSINLLNDRCHVDGVFSEVPPLAPCISGPLQSVRTYQVLIWGDSHADHFVPAIANWANSRGLSARQATKSACRPLLSTQPSIPELQVSADCESFNQAVIDEAANQSNLSTVILSGYWTSTDKVPRVAAERFEHSLDETVASLRRRLGSAVTILVIGTTPVFEFGPATCIARATFNKTDLSRCANVRPTNRRQASIFDPIIKAAASKYKNVRAVILWSTLCTASECLTASGNTILYRDHSHFTVEGGQVVLAPLLANLEVEVVSDDTSGTGK